MFQIKPLKFCWALLAPFSLSVLSAQQVYDGSGNWNLTNTNWDSGNVWIQGSDASFLAPGATLSLETAIQAGNLNFAAPYTITSGQSLSLQSNANLSVQNSSDTVSLQTVLNALDLTKTGTGTLAISNTGNGLTGTVVIQDGTIQATHANTHALGTAQYQIEQNGTLRLDVKNSGLHYVSNAITGNGRLHYVFDNVAGDTELNQLNQFSGIVELTAPATTGNKLRLSSGTYQSGFLIQPNAQLFLNSNASVTVAQEIVLSGTGNNENRGAIRSVNANLTANLQLLGDTTLGYEGNNTLNGNITSGVAGTQTLTFGAPNASGSVTHNGIIGGGLGTIAVVNRTSGSNITTLTGNNTYTGGTSIQTGTLSAHFASGHNALGTGGVSVDSGAKLILQRATNHTNVTLANQISGSGDLELRFAGAGNARDTYLTGLQNFTGKIILSSPSGATGDKLNLSGGGTYQNAFEIQNNAQIFVHAPTTIQGGITLAGNGNTENFGAIRLQNTTLNANLTLTNDASIGVINNSTLNGNVSASAGAKKTLSFGTSSTTGNLDHHGVLENGAGTLAIAQNGNGRTVLHGNNTFTGGVKVNRGTLAVGNVNALNSASPNEIEVSGGAFELNGHSVTTGALRGTPQGIVRNQHANAATLTVNQSVNSSYSGTIEDGSGGGSLSLVKSGQGTLTLRDTPSSYTGTTTIQEGTLRLASAPSAPVTGAIFHLDAQNTASLSGNSDGTGSISHGSSVGQWGDLTGNSNHFLQSNANQKPVYLTNQINGHAAIVFDGSNTPDNDRMVLGQSNQVQSVFILNRPDNLGSLDGIFGANGSDFGVRSSGSTSWQTPGNSSDFTNPAGSILRVNGGTNQFTNNEPQILEIIRSSPYQFTSGIAIGDYWNSSQYNRVYSGAMGEIIAYSGELSAEQRSEIYSYLNYKWFGIQTTQNLLPTSTQVEIAQNATLQLDGVDQQIVSLSGVSGSGVEISQNNTLTLDGGASTQTHTFAGVISGAGSLQKSGNSHQILSGNNTYTGNTQIDSGNLQVGLAGQGSIQSAVTANSGGTLSGTGTIQENVTLIGGHLAAGDQGGDLAGKLTIDGDLIFGVGSTGTWQLATANQANSNANDHVTVTGTVSFSDSSSLDLDFTGYTAQNGDVFDLMDFLSYDDPNILPNFNVIGGNFGALTLDTSMFSVDGTISIVPEPSRLLLAAGALSALLMRRRR